VWRVMESNRICWRREGGGGGEGFRKINEKTEAAATNLFHKRMKKIITTSPMERGVATLQRG
jgi:hypothetical protein